jgi:predicted nucleotidyltransferase
MTDRLPAHLDRDRLLALSREQQWRLVVLFGSVARGEPGRDVDLAVLPAQRPSLFEMGAWQAALEDWAQPLPADLLVLDEALSPVTRFEVFRAGLCLWEAELGLFERERDRAFFLYADSAWFRQQQREALYDELR